VPTLGGDVLLQINTTGKRGQPDDHAVGNTVIAIKFTAQEGRVVRFAILNASMSVPPFFELTGDFTIQSDGDMTLYGARNVEIFLGSMPTGADAARRGNGVLNPNAIGLLVTNATIGLIKWTSAVGAPPPALRGVCLRRGQPGRARRPDDQRRGHRPPEQSGSGDRQARSSCPPIRWPRCRTQQRPDDDADGLIDEAGEQAAIRVKFTSAAKIEEFSAGFNEAGEIDPATR
jgi:hypothetical protein